MPYSCGMTTNAIRRAVEAAGGQAALARLLNVKPPTVNQWVGGERPLSAERCPEIEAATGVRCEELRPDVTWHRIPDPDWPHPAGRPLIDVAAKEAA